MHRLASILLFGLAVAGCYAPNSTEGHLLVFTKTEGFEHASIPDGVDAIRQLGETNGYTIEHTDDASRFTPDALATFDAVVFLNTTGDVLDAAQEAAFQDYIHGGGGFVGVHAAADTEYDWPWYGRLVGTYFQSHPPVQEATLEVTVYGHPATRELPVTWAHTDEWYNYRNVPPAPARAVLHLDASSYDGSTMSEGHPIAWYQDVQAGRSFYTGLGHTSESYADPIVLAHLGGAICWAARLSCED